MTTNQINFLHVSFNTHNKPQGISIILILYTEVYKGLIYPSHVVNEWHNLDENSSLSDGMAQLVNSMLYTSIKLKLLTLENSYSLCRERIFPIGRLILLNQIVNMKNLIEQRTNRIYGQPFTWYPCVSQPQVVLTDPGFLRFREVYRRIGKSTKRIFTMRN